MNMGPRRDKVRAGIGFSENPDSFESGREATASAFRSMGQREGSLILAFCTNRHNYEEIFEGIRSEAGEIPVIGGPAIGVITNDRLGYDGYQVGVGILPKIVNSEVVSAGRLNEGEKRVGIELGRQIANKRGPQEKLLLLFYDAIKSPPPPSPVVNVSSYLLEGFERGLGDEPPLIVGAGLVGSYNFDKGKQFCGSRVSDQQAVAALLSGNFSVYTKIMHGCKPMSDYHRITRVQGPIVYEIDGRPAMDVIDDLLGTQEWHRRLPLLLVTLGVNHGDKYGPYDEESYVNRLIVGVLPRKRAIVLFEADFENGTEFQFMKRSSELMEESAERVSWEVLNDLKKNKQQPFFSLYIDCAGRTSAYSGSEREEASIVQKIIGKEIPLLGFYSGVEIAPLLGKSRGLDWTGVIMVLSRGREDEEKG